ncbi:MAG: DNA-binding domain-containing protein [Verrucomicrobiota bacterium]
MSTPTLKKMRLTSTADLQQLQRTMADALMQPLTRKDGLSPEVRAEEFITPNDRLSASQRLEIYARQYWFRLLDCLHDEYPALRAHLGQRRFHQTCRDYLAEHPSSSWTLSQLGSRLPEFLQDDAARDVARVEWAQSQAFEEAWKKPLLIDDLLGRDPASLRLGLQPCVMLLQLGHAVDQFITALKMGETELRGGASQAHSGASARGRVRRVPRLKRESVHIVIHRHDNRLYFKRLDREAHLLLSALRAGMTLAEAVEAALADASPDKDWSALIRDWFCEWSALGWFCHPSKNPPN